jgi:hypothetical protein
MLHTRHVVRLRLNGLTSLYSLGRSARIPLPTRIALQNHMRADGRACVT